MTFLVAGEETALNPFTATACKYFRAERCTDAPANRIFSGSITSTFSVLRFHDYLFTRQCKKESKKLKGLKYHTVVGHFQVTSCT